jgi:GDP/UDP-N,N'-diacetylbacillosamine 2-epimerase (hydrolysing)
MNIAVLTSSRADYSIYLPLLKKIKADPFFDLSIIAFGTHLSPLYGHTIDQIIQDGFDVDWQLETVPENDSPVAIANSMGKTITEFSKVWDKNEYDLVFCLGDRYEMFAACASSLPFNIKLAHIHGGEQTLGAIDDAFRHSISHMAHCHFPTTDVYYNRIVSLKGNNHGIYNVGALSIDNLLDLELLSIEKFKEVFGIDISKPSVLFTFHPETVSFTRNIEYIATLLEVLSQLTKYQIIITMPNADTMGQMIREKLLSFISHTDNAVGIESFGTLGYLSCMKYCRFMLGNSSSGFVEAAFFSKPVINVGHRQDGRIRTHNIIDCDINIVDIMTAVNDINTIDTDKVIEVYGKGDAAIKIISAIKQFYEKL